MDIFEILLICIFHGNKTYDTNILVASFYHIQISKSYFCIFKKHRSSVVIEVKNIKIKNM